MRQEVTTEEALIAKHQVNKIQKKTKNQAVCEGETSANNKSKGGSAKKSYPPCQHCGRKYHPPFKCWRRPNAKRKKCNKLGHEAVICKNKAPQQEENTQVADQEEEDHLFVATCFSSKSSTD